MCFSSLCDGGGGGGGENNGRRARAPATTCASIRRAPSFRSRHFHRLQGALEETAAVAAPPKGFALPADSKWRDSDERFAHVTDRLEQVARQPIRPLGQIPVQAPPWPSVGQNHRPDGGRPKASITQRRCWLRALPVAHRNQPAGAHRNAKALEVRRARQLSSVKQVVSLVNLASGSNLSLMTSRLRSMPEGRLASRVPRGRGCRAQSPPNRLSNVAGPR